MKKIKVEFDKITKLKEPNNPARNKKNSSTVSNFKVKKNEIHPQKLETSQC